MIGDISDLDVMELAHNIYEQCGPSKQQVLPLADMVVGKLLPSKKDILLAQKGELDLTELTNQILDAKKIT